LRAILQFKFGAFKPVEVQPEITIRQVETDFCSITKNKKTPRRSMLYQIRRRARCRRPTNTKIIMSMFFVFKKCFLLILYREFSGNSTFCCTVPGTVIWIKRERQKYHKNVFRKINTGTCTCTCSCTVCGNLFLVYIIESGDSICLNAMRGNAVQ
jgi:hypothetical protein